MKIQEMFLSELNYLLSLTRLRYLPRLSGDIQRQAKDCFLPDLSVSCSIIVSDGQNQTRPDQVRINLWKEKLQETMLTSTLILWVALFRDIELNRENNNKNNKKYADGYFLCVQLLNWTGAANWNMKGNDPVVVTFSLSPIMCFHVSTINEMPNRKVTQTDFYFTWKEIIYLHFQLHFKRYF